MPDQNTVLDNANQLLYKAFIEAVSDKYVEFVLAKGKRLAECMEKILEYEERIERTKKEKSPYRVNLMYQSAYDAHLISLNDTITNLKSEIESIRKEIQERNTLTKKMIDDFVEINNIKL